MAEEPGSEVLETQSAPAKPLELFVLAIEIEKATDLIKADTFGKSDPYCKVIASSTGQEFRTKVILKELNPIWNERTQFSFFEACNELRFEVWDEDQGSKDDEIGHCTLDTSKFYSPDHNGFAGTLTLQGVKKGSVTVKVAGSHVDPVELEQRAARLEAEAQTQQKTIAGLQAQQQQLEQKQAQLRNEREQVNTEKATLQTTKAAVLQNVADEQAKKKAFDDQAAAVQAETAKLRDLIAERQDAVKAAKAKAAKDGKALEKKEAEKDELLEQLDKLRKELRDGA